MIASGSLTDTLQTLQDSSRRPLVVTSADRADVLLGLAAVNMSGVKPHAAGVIATDGTKIGVRPALASRVCPVDKCATVHARPCHKLHIRSRLFSVLL